MFQQQAWRRIAKRVATLLATVALVLALFNTGRIGIDWSFAASHQHAAHVQDDCAEHVAHASEAPHAMDVDVLGGHQHHHADHAAVPASQDTAPHYHTHPCCVGSVVTVLPAFEAMRMPAAIGGHRLVGDHATRPERLALEGPNEPPRTSSLG